MDMELIKNLAVKHPDKVLQPFDILLREIGFDALSRISDIYGGSTLYIPTKKRIFGGCFAEEMKSEFNGNNFKDLARKYDVCERTVRYIISGHKMWKSRTD